MSDQKSRSITLNNLSLQPCIDKLTAAVLADEKQLQKFASATSLRQQVQILLKTFSHKPKVTIREAVFEIVKELSRFGDRDESKSEELAEESKMLGSKAFSQRLDAEALHLYNEALHLCPDCSPNLPLLYANRSAVLFHMKKYQECLDDINRALDSQYPKNLKHKVLVRRAQCLQLLGRNREASIAVQQARALCEDLAPAKTRDSYFSTLEALRVQFRDAQISTVAPELDERDLAVGVKTSLLHDETTKLDGLNDEMTDALNDYKRQILKYKLFKGSNPQINFMSNALEMREDAIEGRHVVSKRAIKAGSTLFIERPFAYMLLPKFHSTYCYNCITFLKDIPIPCKNCRIVVFCSAACRSQAHPWHRLDCCRLTLTSAGGMAQLALRAVAVAGWPVCSAVMKESPDAGSDEKYNKYTPIARYRALYRLVHHIDKSPVEEQIQYCLASIILATALQNKLEALNPSATLASDKPRTGRLPEGWGTLDEVAALLFRHIGQLVCNGYAIYQVLPSPALQNTKDPLASGCSIESLSQERLASAIFATASLMNHSCKPTTINSYVGNLLVIRNLEEVAPGQKVYSCYGPHYSRHTRAERQSLLQQQYHFTCLCEPCTDPQYLRGERNWCGFICEACGGLATYGDDRAATNDSELRAVEDDLLICHDCGVIKAPSSQFKESCSLAQQLHSEGVSSLEKKDCDVRLVVKKLQRALRSAERVYGVENQFLGSIQDTYAMALSALGSFEASTNILKKSVLKVGRRYGQRSVELGHEIIKLCGVIKQRMQHIEDTSSLLYRQLKREHYYMSDIVTTIFTVIYGEDWQTILNVQI